jgi:hypothetical protein
VNKPSPAREQEFSHQRKYGSGLGQGLIFILKSNNLLLTGLLFFLTHFAA